MASSSPRAPETRPEASMSEQTETAEETALEAQRLAARLRGAVLLANRADRSAAAADPAKRTPRHARLYGGSLTSHIYLDPDPTTPSRFGAQASNVCVSTRLTYNPADLDERFDVADLLALTLHRYMRAEKAEGQYFSHKPLDEHQTVARALVLLAVRVLDQREWIRTGYVDEPRDRELDMRAADAEGRMAYALVKTKLLDLLPETLHSFL